MPDIEHPLQKWFLSNLAQREAMLESNLPFTLLGVDKSGNVMSLSTPTVQLTASLEQRQVLGYLGHDLLSEEALAWPLDTIQDCMSDTKQPNLPSPLTTFKARCNSRCKETSYLCTELGQWPSTLPLYDQILTDSWCIVDNKVMGMVKGYYPSQSTG